MRHIPDADRTEIDVAPEFVCLSFIAWGARRLQFDLGMIVTPQLLCAFAALGVMALIPVVVKRWRARATAHPAKLA